MIGLVAGEAKAAAAMMMRMVAGAVVVEAGMIVARQQDATRMMVRIIGVVVETEVATVTSAQGEAAEMIVKSAGVEHHVQMRKEMVVGGAEEIHHDAKMTMMRMVVGGVEVEAGTIVVRQQDATGMTK